MNLIKKIKNSFKSKDSRVILENFISLSTLELVNIILPLITLPYVLRVVGFTKYGIIVLAASLINYFRSITDYSFKVTATRDVAIFKNDPRKLNLIYSKVITVKILFFLISLIAISLIIYLYPPFYEERLVFFLTVMILIGHALFPEWFFQGIENMKYITVLNASAKIFFTSGIFIFIKEMDDYWMYPLLNGGGWVISGVIGQYILIKKFKLKFIRLNPKIIQNSITSNFPIFLNQFLPTLYNNTSTFLLGLYTVSSLVGIYDAIKKVIDISNRFLKVLSRVFFPYLNRKRFVFHKFKKIMTIGVMLLIVITLLSNKFIFWYLNIDYDNAIYILLILSIGLAGLAMYNIYGLNYFIVRRLDRLVMVNTICASLFGFIIALPMVYYFGIFGAAINLTLTRLLMGGMLMVKYYKYEIV